MQAKCQRSCWQLSVVLAIYLSAPDESMIKGGLF